MRRPIRKIGRLDIAESSTEDMAKDEEASVPPEPNWVDAELREHLRAIEREETPDRLLLLAQELQRLLRANRD